MISNVGFSCLPNAGFTAGCHLALLFPLLLLFGMGAWSKNFNRVAYRITTRRLFIGARPPHQGLHYRGKLFFTSTTSNFQELSREVWSLRRSSTQAIGYNYSGNGGTFWFCSPFMTEGHLKNYYIYLLGVCVHTHTHTRVHVCACIYYTMVHIWKSDDNF